MVRRCCAGYCNNTKDKKKGICLHMFPHGDEKRLAMWNNFVGLKRKDWVKASPTSLLCSAHFLQDDFTNYLEFKMGFASQLYLKDSAVPTISGTSVSRPTAVDCAKKGRSAAVKLSLHRRLHDMSEPKVASQGKADGENSPVTDTVVVTEDATQNKGHLIENPSQPPLIPDRLVTRFTQYSRRHFTRNKGCQVVLAKKTKSTQFCSSTDVCQDTNVQIKELAPMASSTPRKRSSADRLEFNTPKKLRYMDSPNESPHITPTKSDNMDNDPDYCPSNVSFEEVAEDAYIDSQTKTVTDTETPVDMDEKYIVFKSCLAELFNNCPLCSGESTASFPPTKTGTAISVMQVCKEENCGFQRTWNSQPKIGRSFAGNVMASASLLFSGNQFSKINRFFKYLNTPFISKTTFEEHQNKYLFPVVENKWKKDQQEMFSQLKALDEGLHLGGDGRADSPGHCAKYGTYSMMELHLGKVVDLQLVQSNEVKSSAWMELEGLKRSINVLKENELQIDAIVTDPHRSVGKWIRENMEDSKHYFYVWHIAKGLSKKLDSLSLMQDCGLVRKWKKSIINHLYWCAASTPDGNSDMMFAKWRSLSNHIINIHEGHSDDMFPRCEHCPLSSDRRKKWFKPGEKVTVLLEKILTNTWLKKDVRQLSPLGQTSSLEGFHSTILHFAPKHTAFHFKSMHYRVILAAMHFNENAGRERAYTKSGEKKLTVYFTKAKKGEPSVRWERVSPTQEYGHRLMAAVAEAVPANPEALHHSLLNFQTPPPLSAAMKDVNREEAKEKFGTYHRYGQADK